MKKQWNGIIRDITVKKFVWISEGSTYYRGNINIYIRNM